MSLMTLATARTAIESTPGTPVTCTRLLYFETGIHEQVVGSIAPKELRASYRPSFRVYPGIERNSFQFTGDATYDQLAFWLSSAVTGGLSGSGGGADKTWAFTPTSTSDDQKSFTLEYAWSNLLATVGWRVPGCRVDEFSLKFTKGDVVKYSASVRSFKGATQITSFTGSLSDRTEVSLVGTGTQTYIDSTTIGTTADNNVVSSEFKLRNNLVAREPLNATAVGTALVRPMPVDWEFNVVRYFTDKTELDTYLAKTPREIRTRTTGPALGGSNYKLDLDCYGYWDVSKTADVDGLIVANLTLKPLYDSTATGDYIISLVNSLSAIT